MVIEQHVIFSFGIGLIKVNYRLKEIKKYKPFSYIPMGWVDKIETGVILFNVSGNKTIELEIKGKKRKNR